VALLFTVLSSFCSGENLIAAFLPELARAAALGRVSAWLFWPAPLVAAPHRCLN